MWPVVSSGGSSSVAVHPDVLKQVQQVSAKVQSSMKQLDENCDQLLTSMNQNLLAEQQRRRDLAGQVHTLGDQLTLAEEQAVSMKRALKQSQSEAEQVKAAHRETSKDYHRLSGVLKVEQRNIEQLQARILCLEEDLNKHIKIVNTYKHLSEKQLEETSVQSKSLEANKAIESKRMKIQSIAAIVTAIAFAILIGPAALLLGGVGWVAASYVTSMKNCPGMTDLYAKQGSLDMQLRLIRSELERLRKLLPTGSKS